MPDEPEHQHRTSAAAVRVTKNTTMLLLGTVCKMALSFVFVIYVAAYLGLEGFGRYSLALHFFELFLSLTATAIGIYITREIARRPTRLGSLLSQSLLLVVILTIGSAVILAILARLLNYSSETVAAMQIVSLALLPASVAVVLEAVFVALERAEFVTLGITLESVLRISLSFLVLMLGWGLISLFWVLIFTRSILAIYYWLQGRGRIGRLRPVRRRRFLMFVREWRVFAVENWLATIYKSLSVVILSAFHGEAAVGLFTAASRVVSLGSVAAKSYTTAVFPVLSRLHGKSRAAFDELNLATLRYMLAIAASIVVVVFALADRIVGVLYTDEFLGAVPVLRILIWVLLLDFLNPYLSHTLFAKGLQRRSMQVAAISLATHLTITVWLVSQFSAVGAALGSLLAGSMALICYSAFALEHRDLRQLVIVSLRTACAAATLMLVLLWMHDDPWLAVLPTAGLVYLAMLILLRVVTTTDLSMLRGKIQLGAEAR